MTLFNLITPVTTGAVTGSVRTPASSATARVRRAGSPAALKTATPRTPHSATHGSAAPPVSASPPSALIALQTPLHYTTLHCSVTYLALRTTIPAATPAHPPALRRPGSAGRTAFQGPTPALGSVPRGSSHVAQSVGRTRKGTDATSRLVAASVLILTNPVTAAVLVAAVVRR